MKTIRTILTALALCLANVALADDVVIPTTEDNPFDLKKGELTGNATINGSGHIDNTRDGDKAIYTLDNQESVDYYRFKFKTGCQRDDARLHVTVTSQSGTKVLDEEFAVDNNGSWNPSVQHVFRTGKMNKGKYTLIFEFISLGNSYVCRVGDVKFSKVISLEAGDDVPLVNPDFEDGNKGWTNKDLSHRISSEHRGNHYSMCENTKACSISQTLDDMPDGLYMLQVNAFDHVLADNNLAYPYWMAADSVRTFLFINDEQALMKTNFDDRLNVANIYRWYKGVSGNYCFAGNGYFTPSSSGQDAEALALEKGFYKNCLVAPVTSGTITLGWRKTDSDRNTWVCSDNWRLTYISTSTSLQDYANTLKQKPMSRQAKQQLQSAVGRRLANAVGQAETSARLWADIDAQRKVVEQQMADKRTRIPQATAAATAALAENYNDYTDNEAFNYLYRLQELEERLDYVFYDINVETMGTLGDLILQKTENFSDVKSLRVSGQLNDDDLTVLSKRLTELVDLDLSATPVPELPDDALSHHPYLTWLTLPSQLKTLGRSCFYENWNLRTITLPATLETIKPYAFYHCYNIGHAVMPEGVTSIGENAYKESGLQTIVLPTTLQTTSGDVFRSCHDLYSAEMKGLTSITGYSFYDCSHLTSIKMPATLKTIGEWAFEYCRRLENVELNEGLTCITTGAFDNNDSLRTITLPSTMTEIYGSPFRNCKNLTAIISKAVCPPQVKNEAPVSGSTPTVYVPVISDNVYKQTAKWADLPIVGDASLPLPQDISIIGQYNLSWTPEFSATYQPNMHLTNTTDYNTGRVFGHVTVNSGAQLNVKQLNLSWDQKMVYDYVTRDWFGSLINNGTARANDITVEIPMQKNFWYFITFPFDVRVSDIVCTDNDKVPFAIRTYDGYKRANLQPNDTWVNLGASDVMQAGTGYIFRSTNSVDRNTNTFRFTAMQNATKTRFFRDEDVQVELQDYPAKYDFDRSWNFIGNPYPAFFDIRAMQTTAPITIYEWNQGWWGSTLKYVAYSPQDDNYILNPGQAFFIQRPIEGGTLVFRKDGRQHNTDPRPWEYYNINGSRASMPQHQRQVFNLYLAKEELGTTQTEGMATEEDNRVTPCSSVADRTRFVINEGASLSYEPARDAAKFSSMDAASPELYILEDGQRLAIDERPVANGEIQLGLQLPASGTYSISLAVREKPCQTVVLIDKQTGAETDLTTEAYTFDANAGTIDSRFVIRLGAATAVQYVALPTQQTEQLFDLQGRPIANGKSANRKLQRGIYVINRQKVVIK